jgi:DNA-nicking Smr family endonuclease
MKSISLYNNDGTLSSRAQSLLSPKPADLSMSEWRKILRSFKKELSLQDGVEFDKLRRKARDQDHYKNNKDKMIKQSSSYRRNNPDKAKKWDAAYYASHRKQSIERSRNYQKQNPDKRNRISQKWYSNNTERAKSNTQKWKKENPEKRKAGYKRRRLNKQHDPLYCAKLRLRQAVYDSFKRISKNKPTNTLNLLGCTWEEAKAHIESLFREGMNWETRHEWHIDHIRPVSSFTEDELHLMNKIENLQPLWATDDLKKSDKMS